jgi:hypothetical protein
MDNHNATNNGHSDGRIRDVAGTNGAFFIEWGIEETVNSGRQAARRIFPFTGFATIFGVAGFIAIFAVFVLFFFVHRECEWEGNWKTFSGPAERSGLKM